MDFALLLFGASLHWDDPGKGKKEYNDCNVGIGVKLSTPDDDGVSYNVIGGVFENSICNKSRFVGAGLEFGKDIGNGVTIGLQGNIVYLDGYDELTANKGWLLLGAYARVDRYSVHAIILDEAIGFYGEVKF